MDSIYPQCVKYKGKTSDLHVTKEEMERFSEEANVLPLYEKQIYDLVMKKKASMDNNELLKCRWKGYIDRIDKKNTPFHFDFSDIHFKKYLIVYDPMESLKSRQNNRMHLSLGPGVDNYGEMPIPNDTIGHSGKRDTNVNATDVNATNVKTKDDKATNVKTKDVKAANVKA